MNRITRPESVDVYGLRHRYACPGPVTVRPSMLKPGTYARCQSCGAVGILPAEPEPDDGETP